MVNNLLNNYQEILFDTAIIFSSVFEIILAYILVNNFFTPRLKSRSFDFIPFIFVGAGVIFLQQRGMNDTYRYIVECAVMLLFLFLLYKGDIRSKLVGAITFVLLVTASKIGAEFILIIIKKYLGVDNPDTDMKLTGLALSNALMIILAVVISIFARRRTRAAASFRLWLALFTVPVVTITTFSVFQVCLENSDGSGTVNFYIYLSSGGLIFVNLLVFLLFSRLQKQLALQRDTDILTAQLKQQEMSVNRMETLYNRTRAFRHDIKNHILLMNMLAEQENYDGLKKYLRDMSGVIDESDYVRISGISAVDAILNEKMYEAQAESITTGFDVINLDKNNIQSIDLCIILSNALDNAIEANRKIEDTSLRYIKLKVHGNETFSVISVSNPVGEEPKKSANGIFLTSKEDEEAHGFGLKSIENTMKKYKGEMVAKCEDGVFTLVVRLNSPSKDIRKSYS